MSTEMTSGQRALAIAKVTQRNYTEQTIYNEDKTAKVSVYHDHGMFSDDTINNFLALSKRIGKEICLVSWANHNAIKYVKEKFGKRKKVYFFLFGEPELEPCFSAPFDNDSERIRRYSSNGENLKMKYWTHIAQMQYFSDYYQVFDISGQGLSISCDGAMYHFYIHKNVCISLTSFLMSTCPDTMSKYALNEIINSAYSVLKASRERKNYEKLADDFMSKYKNFSLESLKQAPRTLESKLSDLLDRMRSNYIAINNCEREIDTNKALLLSAKNNINNFEEFYARETSNMKSVLMNSFKNRFKEFGFSGYSEIYAITKPIFIETILPRDRDGDGETLRKYLIGQFKISIRINESYVNLINLSNTYENGSYDHPHVRDGRPCLGNLKEEIPRLIKQSDFLAVFLLMDDYLKTINPYGWYTSIKYWKEVPVSSVRATSNIENEEDEDDEEETGNQSQAEAETQTA